MMPATNTMIALKVSRERRGTAFMVGPMGAAMFAKFSLNARFVTVGVLILALAEVVTYAVREPAGER